MSSLGGSIATKRCVNFDETEVNGKEINAMVKQAVTAALKGGG